MKKLLIVLFICILLTPMAYGQGKCCGTRQKGYKGIRADISKNFARMREDMRRPVCRIHGQIGACPYIGKGCVWRGRTSMTMRIRRKMIRKRGELIRRRMRSRYCR